MVNFFLTSIQCFFLSQGLPNMIGLWPIIILFDLDMTDIVLNSLCNWYIFLSLIEIKKIIPSDNQK